MNDQLLALNPLGPAAQAEALADSQMAKAIAAFDWSQTPLGAAAEWPLSLKTAVRQMLGSSYPMFLWWGGSLTALYNDAYIDVLGPRHPWALGKAAQQIWAEIWDVLGPQANAVLSAGRSTWNDRILLVMQRKGFTEETYFTFSYSPAFDDEGNVAGVTCTCTEDTARVLGDRRLQSLRVVSDAVLQARTAEQACAAAASALGGNAHDAPFVAVYLLDENGTALRQAVTGVSRDAAFAPARIDSRNSTAPWPFAQVAEQRSPLRVTDLAARFDAIQAGPWPEPIGAALVLPLAAAQGQLSLAGFVVVGLNPRRPFDDDYGDYLTLAAQRIGAAVADACAFEAEQQRAKALAELDRAKTAFFSNVSHELRTPLTLILGPLADLLGDEAARAPEDTRGLLRLAQRNGRRLQRLVNALLDFSRLEAGRMQPRFEPTDLATMTAEVASLFGAASERAGLRLVIDCPPLAQPVLVDRTAWEKIVFNLLGNALKHTFEGSIQVSVRAEGDAVRLEVRDSGIGIPEALVPRLFERFFRVEGARARSIEGSGIGLALVAELVRLHGGSVEAESREGMGSAFSIRLPFGSKHLARDDGQMPTDSSASPGLAEAFLDQAEDWIRDSGFAALSEASLVTPAGKARSSAPDTRQTVLVADDNADMRAYLTRLLERDHRVMMATDGVDALALVHEELPDLVLTDVMMPRLDGFALLRRLRADPVTDAIPIILLSARAGEEARLEGLEAGADDYLTKPFDARELLARVTGALTLARLRRHAAEDLRQAHEGLQQADRRKDQFLATLAHELRNPLAPLRNAVYLLQKRARDPEVEPVHAMMQRQIDHLVRLVDDLLEVSRITSGKVALQRAPVRLGDVLTNAVETSRPLVEQSRHHLDADIGDAAALLIDGDAVRLAQVFANLINNAARYTPSGGHIELRAWPSGGEAVVVVRDNGEGLAPETLTEVFEPFVQVSRAAASAHGRGLGRALVRSRVALHDGSGAAESEGLGRGSEFTVRLPLATSQQPSSTQDAAAPASAFASTAASPDAPLVLVVDDNRDAADSLASVLEALGARVYVAYDGPAALAAAESARPAIVLLDLGMPDMDGFEVARRLRRQRHGSELLLVALTGWGQPQDQRRAQEAGFDQHLVKPAEPEALQALLRRGDGVKSRLDGRH